MKIEIWQIDKPKPYGKNPRKISDQAVDAVAKSLKEFGWQQPIVVDEDDVIIVGHTRLLAARKLGMTTVPVTVAVGLTKAQAKAYRLADNRTGEFSQWDNDILPDEVAELKAMGFDLDLTGFPQDELSAMLENGGGETDPDEVPETPKEPVTKNGDLWLLGNHRLLCGDSTQVGDVERLMGGERAGLMNTDPPYGIGFDNAALGPTRKNYDAIENDEKVDGELQEFLEEVFRSAVACSLLPNAAWYLWHAHLTQGFFAAAAAAAAAADVVLHRQIIWVKPRLILGRGQYHWKHEPCFMGWVKGNEPPDYGEGHGERTQVTVWEVEGVKVDERREFNHATPKPVGLFTIPIIKHLKTGEICYEPFAGTGPQIIAAETTGRRCFAMEIEPRYCDVIVARWEKFTGRKAVLEARDAG